MTLTIQRLGRRGDGVTDGPDGRVLVPLTLPGEVIDRAIADGRIAAPRILTPSPQRVRPACPHYSACGGCQLQHASDDFVARWKAGVIETALAAQGITAQVATVQTSPERSRRRAVISVRRTKKGALAGFHARASDQVIDVSDCPVIRPRIQAALPALRAMAGIGASRQGELSVVVTDSAAGLDLSVRGGKPADAALLQDMAALAAEQDWARLVWGDTPLTRRPPAQVFGRAQVTPPPGAFLQATAEGEAALLAAVRHAVGDAARIVDLFAGCGTFTLPLAEQAEVHAVEGLPEPLAALDAGWRQTKGLRRVTTESRDLAKRPLMADELNHYDAIVIDPPRAGAEAQAREIAASQVPRVGFVSCDPVTFARDCRILTQGGYVLDQILAVDQFRWSAHVEIVASLRRNLA
ncbi:MAG: class I SAM-dependent RNA methyltransferase [Paracoccus sp. (in: a-proteobacteria)]|uniref:class I SAM-dependent RNA methyltransferase n=1 Tax=Paracoccus sp. TaxID=267 RepID=UPI0026DEB0D5|nr:class I SAM-dependent RNA methyltransferase [Paracoccus sp. (in: a-proteobacteria)]MDO5621787.1 class I SAM-dependent RNA methyltransferase [Paracoccus sp. (in: a-proteobacteria)]